MIGIVVIWNLDCALVFIFRPELYAHQFELSGVPGKIAIAGFGILFLMWNIPYLFAFTNPIRFKVSLIQAFIMQTIGFVGENILFWQIDDTHRILREAILRFILFDGLGWTLLLLALLLVVLSFRSNYSSTGRMN